MLQRTHTWAAAAYSFLPSATVVEALGERWVQSLWCAQTSRFSWAWRRRLGGSSALILVKRASLVHPGLLIV